jgi:hypothetical protein
MAVGLGLAAAVAPPVAPRDNAEGYGPVAPFSMSTLIFCQFMDVTQVLGNKSVVGCGMSC